MQENERKEMALLQYMCVSHSVMSNSLPSQAMPASVSGILQARILEWVTVYKQLLICFITLSHLHQVSDALLFLFHQHRLSIQPMPLLEWAMASRFYICVRDQA